MDKKNYRIGEPSYIIHGKNENTFSDDIGNSFEIIGVKKKNKESADGVWKYFSFARNIVDGTGDKVVCSLCFEMGEIKTYSKVTASTNLWRHLQMKHSIFEDGRKSQKQVVETSQCSLEDGEDDGNVTYIEEVVVDEDRDIEEDTDNKNDVSEDINIAIIEEIFKHPEIYDYKNHKSVKERDRHWDLVANHFKGAMHVEHIKKIWQNIRGRYKKVRNKELRTGVINPPERRYKYYDLLNELDVSGALFEDNSDNKDLSDNEKSVRESIASARIKRRRSSNDDEFSNVEYLNDKAQHIEIDGDDPLSENYEEIITSPPQKIIKTESNHSNSMIDVTTRSTHAVGGEDEYTLFGKLIAEKLRRIPRPRANRLEMKMLALLLIGEE